MRKSIFIFLTLMLAQSLSAQELEFIVTVKAPVNLKADPSIYKSLEKDIFDFINKTKWTEDDFSNEERVKGRILITIQEEVNNQTFIADVSLQTSRPVFKSDYSTPILNYFDKGITINYVPGQQILRSDRSFIDNLSSTLTYYALISLAFDYDSFALYGGEKYFNLVRETYNNLPNGLKRDDSAWTNQGSNGRNKYFFIDNIMSPRLRPFRQIFYEYHRLALDKMYENAEMNRAVLLSSLNVIEDLHHSFPNSFLLQVFNDTKYQELIEIFKIADSGQKTKLRALMTLTNIGNADRFDALK